MGPGDPLTLLPPFTPPPPFPLTPPARGVGAAGHPCGSAGGGWEGGRGREGGGQIAKGQTMPSLPPPPCSSHIWQEKSCFPMLSHSWLGNQEYGTPTNVRTTNVGNDKRQNDKRQKGQTSEATNVRKDKRQKRQTSETTNVRRDKRQKDKRRKNVGKKRQKNVGKS